MYRVLVADDEAGMVRLAKRLLERTGRFEVVATASNGEQAIEVARETDVDLVLLDIMMPGVSGLQALPSIRQARPDVRVVIWSMLSDPETVQQALAGGAVACIDKGDDPMGLALKMSDLLESPPPTIQPDGS